MYNIYIYIKLEEITIELRIGQIIRCRNDMRTTRRRPTPDIPTRGKKRVWLVDVPRTPQ